MQREKAVEITGTDPRKLKVVIRKTGIWLGKIVVDNHRDTENLSDSNLKDLIS